MRTGNKWIVPAAVMGVLGAAQAAQAHPGHGGGEFHDGFLHPVFGLDHLLAMVAVGLLAVRIGGRALIALPGIFLGGMLLGGAGAVLTLPVAAVEMGILASVLVLGLLVASASVVSLRSGAELVGAFALFHGYAHAAEMAAGSSFASYAAGFLLATALLHASGIAGGLMLARFIDSRVVRLAGGAIAAAGALLLLSAI